MPNYQLGKVYKLVNNVDDKIYVGSTCHSLKRRKQEHKDKSKISPNTLVYRHIVNIGWDNVDIVLIEDVPCNSKEELWQRERYYTELYNSELNTLRPITSVEEKRETRQIYHQNNIDEIIEKRKIHYQKNITKMSEKNKKYYYNNIEKMSEKNKKWRQNNKEKIKEERKIRYDEYKNIVKCKCGGTYNSNFSCKKERHENTEKHNKYLAFNINLLFWNPKDELLV
jgi:hypothetical protein